MEKKQTSILMVGKSLYLGRDWWPSTFAYHVYVIQRYKPFYVTVCDTVRLL